MQTDLRVEEEIDKVLSLTVLVILEKRLETESQLLYRT